MAAKRDVIDHRRLAAGLLGAVSEAGAVVMAHYRRGAAAEHKADRSPVTAADRDSEALLTAAVERLAPETPIVAEEAAAQSGAITDPGDTFFLIDPLDGTKEFLAGETDFTLNIALIARAAPRFGLVYAPALEQLYVTLGPDRAARAQLAPGAAVTLDALTLTPIRSRPAPSKLTATVSRSHLNEATRAYLARLPIGETVTAGSSLKFCRIAEGQADIYPRLAPTMEWDTAAGDAVLRAAGGVVLDGKGDKLAYGKAGEGFLNRGFVAWGRMPSGSSTRA